MEIIPPSYSIFLICSSWTNLQREQSNGVVCILSTEGFCVNLSNVISIASNPRPSAKNANELKRQKLYQYCKYNFNTSVPEEGCHLPYEKNPHRKTQKQKSTKKVGERDGVEKDRYCSTDAMSEKRNGDVPQESLSIGEARSDKEPEVVNSVRDEPSDKSSPATSPGPASHLPRMSAIDETDELSSRSFSAKAGATKAFKSESSNLPSQRNGRTQGESDKRKQRYTSQRVTTSRNGRVFDDSPKPERESHTSSAHEIVDQNDRRTSSLKFPFMSGRRDRSDSSSSSSHSASNTQKTDSGLLESAKGEKKFIHTSRVVFFAIIGVSAIVVAVSTYFLVKAIETGQFKKEVRDMCMCDFLFLCLCYCLHWSQPKHELILNSFFIANPSMNSMHTIC